MNYDGLIQEKWQRPKSSFDSFLKVQSEAVTSFLKDNRVIEKIESNAFTLDHYHSLLRSVFHQVYFSSTSFGMAGAMSSLISPPSRTYLLHHAEEEMSHWTWILQDLQATGYKGADPRSEHPNWAAQSYLSYGVYLALFNPLGRLAMAQVLEGISGTFGTSYGMKALMQLKLKKEQAQFFLVHGELDQGHAADINDVLKKEDLTPEQWADMEHIARVTSQLYKNIYNFSMESGK